MPIYYLYHPQSTNMRWSQCHSLAREHGVSRSAHLISWCRRWEGLSLIRLRSHPNLTVTQKFLSGIGKAQVWGMESSNLMFISVPMS